MGSQERQMQRITGCAYIGWYLNSRSAVANWNRGAQMKIKIKMKMFDTDVTGRAAEKEAGGLRSSLEACPIRNTSSDAWVTVYSHLRKGL